MSRLSIEIPEPVHRQIKAQASLQGLSIREYVLRRLAPDERPGAAEAETQYPASMREWLKRPSRATRTRDQIDTELAAERASWNDNE